MREGTDGLLRWHYIQEDFWRIDTTLDSIFTGLGKSVNRNNIAVSADRELLLWVMSKGLAMTITDV